MAEELDFIQIYYDDRQLPELYDFAIPYKNPVVSVYFENEVISNVVPNSDADFIGVGSWRLRQKREQGSCPIILKDTSLSKEKILNQDADIMNLRPFIKSHKMLSMASNWHHPHWNDCLKELKKFIRVPDEVSNPIYENHFIARKEIYYDYVLNTLRPCMAFIDDRMDVFGRPSGYVKKLAREPQRIEAYKKETGLDDWPMVPFVLERLFSIWIEGKGFKIVNV